jgi:microcystin-dependent protein
VAWNDNGLKKNSTTGLCTGLWAQGDDVSQPYLSEIKIMAFGFAPKGWAQCNGQLLSVQQNQALFSRLGTTYGGDGVRTFGLPNLQGRTPTHMGGGLTLGQSGGEQTHTLSISELPSHLHQVNVSSVATDGTDGPVNNYFGGYNNLYHAAANLTPIQPNTVGPTGGSQPHDNMQPYLTLNFCIALQGVFPSPN